MSHMTTPYVLLLIVHQNFASHFVVMIVKLTFLCHLDTVPLFSNVNEGNSNKR